MVIMNIWYGNYEGMVIMKYGNYEYLIKWLLDKMISWQKKWRFIRLYLVLRQCFPDISLRG